MTVSGKSRYNDSCILKENGWVLQHTFNQASQMPQNAILTPLRYVSEFFLYLAYVRFSKLLLIAKISKKNDFRNVTVIKVIYVRDDIAQLPIVIRGHSKYYV